MTPGHDRHPATATFNRVAERLQQFKRIVMETTVELRAFEKQLRLVGNLMGGVVRDNEGDELVRLER
jgi:hypothetical protein